MRQTLTTLLICLPLSAAAWTSAGGDTYVAECNENGAVMTTPDAATLYLGRSCDAFSPPLGDGRWGWANGGFSVTVGDQRLTFPRQEFPCFGSAPLPDFGLSCTEPP